MKIGFIGAGNMATAIIKGLIEKQICSNKDIIASDIIPELLKQREEELNINTTNDNKEVVKDSEIIFLSVKPQIINTILTEIKEEVNDKIVISIAAGIKISQIESILENKKIVRVMPNTPALVGEAAMGFAPNKNLNEEETKIVEDMLNSTGKALKLEEQFLDAVTGLSGSGPAFVASLIEAFTEAGIQNGLKKEVAHELSLKTFQGTAKLLLEKNLEPNKLIEMVSSPNGTTIAGMEILENSNLKEIINKTITKATERSKELSKE